jgi:hypothetical protein
MFAGQSEEERVLAGEESGAATRSSPAAPAKIYVDRETDDTGAFFVAYIVAQGHPNDFHTFGARNRKTAVVLAEQFARKSKMNVMSIQDGMPPGY